VIRINLLPKAERRSDIPYARVSLFFVILCLVGLMVAVAGEGVSIWLIEKEQIATATHYDELLPVRQAMEQVGDKEKQIAAKKVIIDELVKSRTLPYNIYIRIAAVMPDLLWLDETSNNKDDAKVITLKGQTVDYATLAIFISKLETQPYLNSVTLKSVEGDVQSGTLKFTLNLKVKEL